MNAAASEGIVCLANDGIIDGLIALCQSLSAHSPDIPMTVIPFDRNLDRTREVLAKFGYDLYDDQRSLQAVDRAADRYWPGDPFRAHSMRKFCAFWGPYERFLFLDADIVVLRSLWPYFEAFRTSSADLMYFWADHSMVYRGSLLDRMRLQGSVGFQTGVFMGRRGTFDEHALETLVSRCQTDRHEFVDILEQTFLNYVFDSSDLEKVSAHQAVPDVVDAWAGMRVKRRGDGFVLADARRPESGRPVSLIHWGGYRLGPFMPYRGIFLTYRLAGTGRTKRISHRIADLAKSVRWIPPRPAGTLAFLFLRFGRRWLASRGYPAWLG